MTISFGNVTELKKVDKPFTSSFNISANYIGVDDVGDPTYKLESNRNLDGVNYAKIDNNYYWVKRPVHEHGFTYVSLHRDPLKTFASYILNSNAAITRCNRGDRYIADERAIATERVAVQYRSLGTPFTSGATYIIVKGV